MTPLDRNTPSPSCGEWEPESDGRHWRLRCRACGGAGPIVEAPLGFGEARRAVAAFEAEHGKCVEEVK